MDQALHPLTGTAVVSAARRGGWPARLTPIAVLLVILAPIAVGLVYTLLPAIGYLPAVGGHGFDLAPWREVLRYPGLTTAIVLSVFTGITATAVSLGLSVAFCAVVHGRVGFRRAEAMLAPILAAPHAAVAIGFAFVVAPSG